MKFRIWIYFSMTWIAAAQQEDIKCGSILVTSSGWFTSPQYPQNYPDDTFCEWNIKVYPGNVIEISFVDFQVDDRFLSWDDTRNDYVVIFENSLEEDGVYFYTPIFDSKYRSTTNQVTIQFKSDNIENFKGFNATYDSWNAIDFCDKSTISTKDVLDCQDEIKNDFYKVCYVSCDDGYVLKRSSKVTCQNGRFIPENPCGLIDFEAILCNITNMDYCIYTAHELANYWWEQFYQDRIMKQDIPILDVFPDPLTLMLLNEAPPDEMLILEEIETSCSGESLLFFNYCQINENGKHTFHCTDFLNTEESNIESAARRMDACFKCRKNNCQQKVYVKER